MSTLPPEVHRPLVARVLSDEGHYGNGPPTWDQASTRKKALKARLRAIKRLRRFRTDFTDAQQLAEILEGCKPGQRCMSGACPACTRAFRRWFVSETQKLVNDAENQSLHCVSVVFTKSRTGEDQLLAFDPANMRRSLSDKARETDGLTWMVGGVDLSLNDDSQKSLGIAWQPQIYAIAQATEGKGSFENLRKSHKSNQFAKRPVQVKTYDGSTKAVAYAYKPDFLLRIAYEKVRFRFGEPKTCWETRKVSLRPKGHVQAMLWMNKVGLVGRLLLVGVRMTRIGDSVGLVKIRKLE
jgi:hypothetical protein